MDLSLIGPDNGNFFSVITPNEESMFSTRFVVRTSGPVVPNLVDYDKDIGGNIIFK